MQTYCSRKNPANIKPAINRTPARSKSCAHHTKRHFLYFTARFTWHSGSPNLQLNSRTLGPSSVSIRPAYNTPTYFIPSCFRPSTAFCKTFSLTNDRVSFETWPTKVVIRTFPLCFQNSTTGKNNLFWAVSQSSCVGMLDVNQHNLFTYPVEVEPHRTVLCVTKVWRHSTRTRF